MKRSNRKSAFLLACIFCSSLLGFVFDRTPASAITDNERLYSCTDDSDCNEFYFTAVICDPAEFADAMEADDDEDGVPDGNSGLFSACWASYGDGELDSFIVNSERTVAAGQYLLVVPTINPSETTGNKPISLKATIAWSSNSFEFVTHSYGGSDAPTSLAAAIDIDNLPSYKKGTKTNKWKNSEATISCKRLNNCWVVLGLVNRLDMNGEQRGLSLLGLPSLL